MEEVDPGTALDDPLARDDVDATEVMVATTAAGASSPCSPSGDEEDDDDEAYRSDRSDIVNSIRRRRLTMGDNPVPSTPSSSSSFGWFVWVVREFDREADIGIKEVAAGEPTTSSSSLGSGEERKASDRSVSVGSVVSSMVRMLRRRNPGNPFLVILRRSIERVG